MISIFLPLILIVFQFYNGDLNIDTSIMLWVYININNVMVSNILNVKPIASLFLSSYLIILTWCLSIARNL